MRIELSELVIQLHNIARLVEQGYGNSEISKELRKCADKLHEVAVEIDRREHEEDL